MGGEITWVDLKKICPLCGILGPCRCAIKTDNVKENNMGDRDKYYRIYMNEDGEIYIGEYSKELLLQDMDEYSHLTYCPTMPKSMAIENWPADSAIIIKGHIVTPKPKEVIKTYDIE